MSMPRFATWIVINSLHAYVQLHNCRVCRHVCDQACNVNCVRIAIESMHFCVQLSMNNCRVCEHVCAKVSNVLVGHGSCIELMHMRGACFTAYHCMKCEYIQECSLPGSWINRICICMICVCAVELVWDSVGLRLFTCAETHFVLLIDVFVLIRVGDHTGHPSRDKD